MRAGILVAGLAWCVAAATPASAQQPTGQRFSGTTSLTPNRDVILEIPELAVDSIGLTVADVRAHVALDANAMKSQDRRCWCQRAHRSATAAAETVAATLRE